MVAAVVACAPSDGVTTADRGGTGLAVAFTTAANAAALAAAAAAAATGAGRRCRGGPGGSGKRCSGGRSCGVFGCVVAAVRSRRPSACVAVGECTGEISLLAVALNACPPRPLAPTRCSAFEGVVVVRLLAATVEVRAMDHIGVP